MRSPRHGPRSASTLLIAALLAPSLLHAKPPKASRPAPAPAPTAAPAREPAPAPAATAQTPTPAAAAPSAPAAVPDLSVEEHLKRSAEAFDGLEFDQALAHASAALARADIKDEQRVTAYRLQAGAWAVMGQNSDAERAYRLLLRLRPDFEFPSGTAPKIVAAFNAVKAEETAIRRAVEEAERKRLIESLRLDVTAPEKHKGGTPMDITVKTTDPQGGIRAVVLNYRTESTAGFAALPMQSTEEGTWVARFSGAQMSTPRALTFEYSVVARDRTGASLVEVGTAGSPRGFAVEAGTPEGPPIYKNPLFWVVSTGVVVGAVALAAAVVLVGGAAVTAGGAGGYLLVRGDGTPTTTLGKQTYP